MLIKKFYKLRIFYNIDMILFLCIYETNYLIIYKSIDLEL